MSRTVCTILECSHSLWNWRKDTMQMWIEGQLQMSSSQRGSVFQELTEVISDKHA